MDNSLTILITIIAYAALLILIGLRSHNNETENDYLIGSRSFGTLPLVVSICLTWLSSGWLMFTAIMISADLNSFYALAFATTLAPFLMIFMAENMHHLAKEHNVCTMPGLVKATMGSACFYLVSVVVALIYFLWVLFEFVAASTLASALTDIDYRYIIGIMAIVCGVYMALGGFKAIIGTDMVQAIFAGILLLLMFIYAPEKDSSAIITHFTSHNFDTPSFLITSVVFFIGFLYAGEIWQRIFAARDGQTAKKVMLYSTIISPIVFTLVLGYLFTSLYLGNPDLSPEMLLKVFIEDQIPQIFYVFALAALLSIIMSTLDSIVFIAAQAISTDVMANMLERVKVHPRLFLRFATVAVLILAVICAIIFRDITDILYACLAIWAVLAPIIYPIILKQPPSKVACFVTIALCLIVSIALIATDNRTDTTTMYVFFSGLTLPFIFDALINIKRRITP